MTNTIIRKVEKKDIAETECKGSSTGQSVNTLLVIFKDSQNGIGLLMNLKLRLLVNLDNLENGMRLLVNL